MLIDQLNEDMKTAMKAGERERLSLIRMLLSELKNARIAAGEDLDEAAEHKVIASYAKKRKEAIVAYRDGGRGDLADREQNEYDLAVAYLPAMLGEDELKAIVKRHIDQMGAQDMKAMGLVMKAVLGEVGSRADGAAVSALVKELLS